MSSTTSSERYRDYLWTHGVPGIRPKTAVIIRLYRSEDGTSEHSGECGKDLPMHDELALKLYEGIQSDHFYSLEDRATAIFGTGSMFGHRLEYIWGPPPWGPPC